MTCVNHAEVENTAFCTQCGKPLCAQCVRQIGPSVYCEACLANSLGANTGGKKSSGPQGPHVLGGSSPEAAFVLGLIPGVGAIYNGEFFKAAFHVLIFGALATLSDHARRAETFFGLLAFGFFIYMPFEAYFTAKKRKLAREGVVLETPFDRFNDQLGSIRDRELWGGVALVVIGGLFLLDNFGVISIDRVFDLWPVLLILAGLFMIRRFRQGDGE